ncbi:phospholipase/Carboxylesterase domain-containing protein [Sarocladium implicatum]|nr:phospholipase/Carboxylesterase domain-containing protein [Sarocladium implicatum]
MPPNEHPAGHPSPGEPIHLVEPLSVHTHTFILLHGLGSNGEKFGKELLETGTTSAGLTLPQLFPGARFVFPTARKRRSSAFGRSVITQWFDIANLQDPSICKEKQLQGLAESAQEIMSLIQDEVKRVPAEKLILGGLSQGCAMSLAVLLSLGYPIGGYIGMSGYLNYQSELHEAVQDEGVDDDNPFDVPDSSIETAPCVKAQVFERDLLNISALDHPEKSRTAHGTPVFLGHGEADEKVPIMLGQGAARVVKDAGYEVRWEVYEDQGHWYKIPDEMDDIVDFISSAVGWSISSG